MTNSKWAEEHKIEKLHNLQKEMIIEGVENFVKYWQGQFDETEATLHLFWGNDCEARRVFDIQEDHLLKRIREYIMDENNMRNLTETMIWLWENPKVLNEVDDWTHTAKLKFKELI